MKIKHLLIGMLAVAAAVACKQDEPVETPKLDVDKEAVAVAAVAGEASFNVTSNQSWVASADQDWVSITPASGDASEKAVAVKVTAEDNETTDARTATVTVKAGELTKTVKVTQAAGENTDTPTPPEPSGETYILVGEAVGGWNVDENGVVLTLKDGYYVAKEVPVTAKKGMHFTKNNNWEGNVKGLHGLIAPNEIGEVGNNDISLTEGGAYDVYLTEALDKFYFMSIGKLPSEAVEHVEIAVTWGVCGAIDGNQWGSGADVELTADGEWLSAKGIAFTEVNFKVRGNNSWADDVKWGAAASDQTCELNKAIAVSTCTEFKAANPEAGDNPNVYIPAGAGTYDVYFSPDKKEVWVMTPGYKPGDEVPVTPGPDPDPTLSEWYLVGTFVNWDSAAGLQLTVLNEDYHVYYGLELGADAKFKFLKGKVWGSPEVGANVASVEPNTIQVKGSSDIWVNTPGTYDVYLAADESKFYIMSEGKTPAEATEPAPVEVTYTLAGTLKGQNWNNAAEAGRMAQEGDYYVVKNVELVWESTLYGGAEQIALKIFETGTWNGYGAAEAGAKALNTEIAVSTSGGNIELPVAEGTYDVYFDKENEKVWVMQPGLKPGETPEPEPEYELDGKQWLLSASGMYVLVDLGLYEEDAMVIAIPLMDGSGFGAYMYGTYEIEKANNTSGKIVFTQYDPEWDEWMEPVDYAYSDLSDELVMINAEPITGYPDALPFVAVAEPYEIIFESAGGDPVGPIENGQYWFFNGTKVMAPLAEGETTGTFPAGNVIDGASTEKNIFTLMYDPDMSYYTIMDSYGRYVGHTDWESGNLTVTDVLPTGDDYAYYLWCVDNSYADGTYDIYNAATYFGFAYSATENCWYADENSYDTDGIRPTLVLAENPVEEPVEPAGPKVVTVAEFLAASDNTIEYQVSGTITGIYQAYNASYGNISIYIADETGEMLAYRLSCAGIDDPANTITKGDLITVKGMRTLYNETPQMAQGCVIVEHTDVIIEAPAGSATLSFADKANRTTFTTSQQVWEQNGVKLINDKGSSTSNVADYAAPARFYKSSKITVEYAGMTKIEFTCNNGSYATALKSSITTGTVSVNGSVVTVVLPAAADSYVISSLTGGQVRMDSLTVYTE